MDQRLKQIVLEKFESKKQQKFFFAKCNDDSLSKKEKKKWCNMADEFAKDTTKLPTLLPKSTFSKCILGIIIPYFDMLHIISFIVVIFP